MEFLDVDDTTYLLESIDVKMIGKEYNFYPDGVTGTYKKFQGFDDEFTSINVSIAFYVFICGYYLFSVLYTMKLNKIYKLARYVCSLK